MITLPTKEYLKYANGMLKYEMIPLTFEEWLKLDEAEASLPKLDEGSFCD